MDYNNVWSLINKANLSKRAMAKIIGMTGTGFDKMMDNKTMTVDVLEKVATYFKVPLTTFFSTEDSSLMITAPKASETDCLKCIDKEKRLEDLTREVKKGEYTIGIQDKLITEYELQLGKKGGSNCG